LSLFYSPPLRISLIPDEWKFSKKTEVFLKISA